MNVYLQALLISQDEPRREARQDIRSVSESERRERSLRLASLRPWDHEVQIRMRSGLITEQRVDTPAAVDPISNRGSFKSLDDLDDFKASHDPSESSGKVTKREPQFYSE